MYNALVNQIKLETYVERDFSILFIYYGKGDIVDGLVASQNGSYQFYIETEYLVFDKTCVKQ